MSDRTGSEIWVFLEQRKGVLADVGKELVTKALEQAEAPGWSVAGVLVGSGLEGPAREAASLGLDRVLAINHPLLEDYCNETYTKALCQALAGTRDRARPQVVLIGATALGMDLAPRLAARLRTGLSAHCVDLEITPQGDLLAVVPGWGGSVMAKISCPKARPQMATVRPGVFEPARSGTAKEAETEEFRPDLDRADLTYRILERVAEKPAESDLDGARVVVAGGWGVGSEEDWKLIEELAGALNGAVGATRPPVDEGWAEEGQMIGTSGRTVSPDLYIGVGLSGNPHHTVGLKNVGLSVGINSDPDSPLFEYCDVGLVGDLKEILPALIERITG